MASWHFGDDAMPEMRGSRESVHEDDGLTRAARTGGVVVESHHTQIHEFAAHVGKMDRVCRCDKRELECARTVQAAVVATRNTKITLAFRDEIDILRNRPQLRAASEVDLIV